MLITRTNEDHCPRCKQKLDAATSSTGYDIPKPGDLSVCLGCQAVLQWDDSMKLQLADLSKIPLENLREIARVILAIETSWPLYRARVN